LDLDETLLHYMEKPEPGVQYGHHIFRS
jgi:hypothetical protein